MGGGIDILGPGCNLIVAFECSEGMGSQEYVEAQKRLGALGADGFLADIGRKRFADIDEWETQMQLRATKAGSVFLYSGGLSAGDRKLTGVRTIDSVEQAGAQNTPQTGRRHTCGNPASPYPPSPSR